VRSWKVRFPCWTLYNDSVNIPLADHAVSQPSCTFLQYGLPLSQQKLENNFSVLFRLKITKQKH
jgi:hypothetical protein